MKIFTALVTAFFSALGIIFFVVGAYVWIADPEAKDTGPKYAVKFKQKKVYFEEKQEPCTWEGPCVESPCRGFLFIGDTPKDCAEKVSHSCSGQQKVLFRVTEIRGQDDLREKVKDLEGCHEAYVGKEWIGVH